MARIVSSNKTSKFLALASVSVIVAALYLAREVLIPVALALMVAFLLAPLVTRLERWGLGRVISSILVVSLACLVVGTIAYVVYGQTVDLASQLPTYRSNIEEKIRFIRQNLGGELRKAVKTGEEIVQSAATEPTNRPSFPGSISNPVNVQVVDNPNQPTQMLAQQLWPLLSVIASALIVVVFVLFMLVQREDLRDRLIRLIGRGQLTTTTQALDDAGRRISRYLLAQSAVNGTYGLSIAAGLWIIGQTLGGEQGFPNFALWGLLCALLRFIPYIGPWLGAAFPLLVAVAVFHGSGVFFATLGLFIIIELITSNLLEPNLYGSSTGVSATAILVAAVFWTWLWGPVGLLLSTPLTVCLVVMGKYVPQMQFLDVLLGDAPVLSPRDRLYQRLLAMDQEEASEVIEDHLKTHTLEQTFDELIVPALGMAEHDRHRGTLDENRQAFIQDAIGGIVDDLDLQEIAAREAKTAAEAETPASRTLSTDNGNTNTKIMHLPKGCVVTVLCLPANDEADELTARMFAQVLRSYGYSAQTVSITALAGEMMERVQKTKADVVCVCALPPAAVLHARYLCKRLHARFPDLAMLVGLWNLRSDLKNARDKIACQGNVEMASSFSDALLRLRQLAQPAILRNRAVKPAPTAPSL